MGRKSPGGIVPRRGCRQRTQRLGTGHRATAQSDNGLELEPELASLYRTGQVVGEFLRPGGLSCHRVKR